MRIYRRIAWGALAEFNVLDTRQYRTDQPTPVQGSDFLPFLPAGGNPAGTLMGAEQEAWLYAGLRASAARRNVIAQQVMMERFNFGRFFPPPIGPALYNVDQWDGYSAARQRLLDVCDEQVQAAQKNFVGLSGDIHSSWAFNLLKDIDNPSSRIVASEYVCTSITSSFLPPNQVPAIVAAAQVTPWNKFFDAGRGYVRCTLTPDRWLTEFRQMAMNPARSRC